MQLHDKKQYQGIGISLQPKRRGVNGASTKPNDTKLSVSWIRKQCRGFAFVTCRDEIEAQRLMGDLSGRNGLTTRMSRGKSDGTVDNRQVMVHGPSEVCCWFASLPDVTLTLQPHMIIHSSWNLSG